MRGDPAPSATGKRGRATAWTRTHRAQTSAIVAGSPKRREHPLRPSRERGISMTFLRSTWMERLTAGAREGWFRTGQIRWTMLRSHFVIPWEFSSGERILEGKHTVSTRIPTGHAAGLGGIEFRARRRSAHIRSARAVLPPARATSHALPPPGRQGAHARLGILRLPGPAWLGRHDPLSTSRTASLHVRGTALPSQPPPLLDSTGNGYANF